MGTRFWEVDAGRGVAVVMMVFFHALFDLRYFVGRAPALPPEFWFWFPRATAGLFIFLAGVSLAIGYGRSGARDFPDFTKKIVSRGAKIFALGLLITLATYVYLNDNGTIWFGILHFIGAGLIISLAFVRSDFLAAVAAVASFATGFFVDKLVVDAPWLIWLGFTFPGFYSLDYFPLFPWLGVMLLGVVAGRKLFTGGKRNYAAPAGENNSFSIAFVGRHSLAIYLLHQPILIALILWLA